MLSQLESLAARSATRKRPKPGGPTRPDDAAGFPGRRAEECLGQGPVVAKQPGSVHLGHAVCHLEIDIGERAQRDRPCRSVVGRMAGNIQ